MLRGVALPFTIAAIGLQNDPRERFFRARRALLHDALETLSRSAERTEHRSDWEAASFFRSAAACLSHEDPLHQEGLERALAALRAGKRRDTGSAMNEDLRRVVRRAELLCADAARLELPAAREELETLGRVVEALPALLEMLRRINRHREVAGVPFIGLSFARSRSALRRLRRSDAEWPSPADAVDGWLATLFERVPLLDPALRQVGIAWSQGRAAVEPDEPREIVSAVVVYPPRGVQNVPTRFRGGRGVGALSAVPAKTRPAGPPITVTFYGPALENLSPRADIRATVADGLGRQVPCVVTHPGRPANGRVADNARSICVLPLERLRTETVYRATVTISGGEPREYKTEFRTGRQ